MKYEDALYAMFGNDLVLKHKIKNKRRRLADQILHLESKLNLTQEQAAKVVKIPLVYLLEMEQVDLKIPVNEYLLTIQKLRNYEQQLLYQKHNENS